jgi:hypothetical protein
MEADVPTPPQNHLKKLKAPKVKPEKYPKLLKKYQ